MNAKDKRIEQQYEDFLIIKAKWEANLKQFNALPDLVKFAASLLPIVDHLQDYTQPEELWLESISPVTDENLAFTQLHGVAQKVQDDIDELLSNRANSVDGIVADVFAHLMIIRRQIDKFKERDLLLGRDARSEASIYDLIDVYKQVSVNAAEVDFLAHRIFLQHELEIEPHEISKLREKIEKFNDLSPRAKTYLSVIIIYSKYGHSVMAKDIARKLHKKYPSDPNEIRRICKEELKELVHFKARVGFICPRYVPDDPADWGSLEDIDKEFAKPAQKNAPKTDEELRM